MERKNRILSTYCLNIDGWPTLVQNTVRNDLSRFKYNDVAKGEPGNPELNVTDTKTKRNKQKDKRNKEQNHCQISDENNGDKKGERSKQKWTPLNIDVVINDRGTARSRYGRRERSGGLNENKFYYEKKNTASEFPKCGCDRKYYGRGQNNIRDQKEMQEREEQQQEQQQRQHQQQQRQDQQQQQEQKHYRRQNNRHQTRGNNSTGNETVLILVAKDGMKSLEITIPTSMLTLRKH